VLVSAFDSKREDFRLFIGGKSAMPHRMDVMIALGLFGHIGRHPSLEIPRGDLAFCIEYGAKAYLIGE
jgi:hypothetical protein